MTFISTSRRGVQAPESSVLGDALDEICWSYIEWREETDAAGRAYRSWCEAPHEARRAPFAAYVAALDREQAAAERYARSAADVAIHLGQD